MAVLSRVRHPGLDFGWVKSYRADVIGEVLAVRKFVEVAEARAVMTDAIGWSVVKWLREKKRVRKIADCANALLDRHLETIRSQWDKELLAAYRDGDAGGATAGAAGVSARKLRQADEQARRARMDAEATFDEAEKQLSTALAREGCRKAIRSWDLYEKAIHLSEEAAGTPSSR